MYKIHLSLAEPLQSLRYNQHIEASNYYRPLLGSGSWGQSEIPRHLNGALPGNTDFLMGGCTLPVGSVCI